jgi:hypothetical protein
MLPASLLNATTLNATTHTLRNPTSLPPTLVQPISSCRGCGNVHTLWSTLPQPQHPG